MSEFAQRTGVQRNSSRVARYLGVSYHQISVFAALCDATLILCASILGDLSYKYWWYGTFPDANISFGVGIVACVIYAFIGRSWGLYSLPALLAPQQRLSALVLAWAMVFLVLVFVLFLLKVGPVFSRGSMIAFASFGLVLLTSFRLLANAYLRAAMAKGWVLGRRTVIIGESDELAVLDASNLLYRFGIEEVARVALSKAWTDGRLGMPRSECAKVDRAIEIARDSGASELVVALHWSSTALIELVRDRLRSSPLPVRLLPDSNIRSMIGCRQVAEGNRFSVELQREPLTDFERAVKRAVDIGVASAMLLALSPLL